MSIFFFLKKINDLKTETIKFIKVIGNFKKLKVNRGDWIISYSYFFSLMKFEPLLSRTKKTSKFSFKWS